MTENEENKAEIYKILNIFVKNKINIDKYEFCDTIEIARRSVFLAIRFIKVIALIRLLQTLTLYRLVCFYYNLPPFYIKKLPFGFLFAERAVFYIPSGAFIFQ